MRYATELINRRRVLNTSALSYEQFPLLKIAIHHEGSSMQEIARLTNQDKSGILRGLRSLERRGFIMFRNDPSDMRKRLVFPTRKARELSRRIVDDVEALEKELLHGVSAGEMRIFLEVMRKLTDRCVELGATKFQRYRLKGAKRG
ncbi:MAG TPA: MarR family transcriptional regulator [Chitinivibrionales bacterium]|nr:MarR family transcriptional regulator [Chitinivibrionales bacterium]